MDHLYQLNLFILSTTTLFTDIKPMGYLPHNWFDAQKQCLGRGLTIEINHSDKPYWTGIYRRLTPWINILGCYSDSIETLRDVTKKTMIFSSVGMCQEMCFNENGYKFAVKMKNCLCFKSGMNVSFFDRLSPSECNYKSGNNSDSIYSEECGGERAYNIYEIQGVKFNSLDTCLSLQCSNEDTRFIPKKCSTSLQNICENGRIPDNGFGSSWGISMKQCKNSQPSHYLVGDLRLNDPTRACIFLNYNYYVVWVGVARQVYTSIDQGYEIQGEQRNTFQECQICLKNGCLFKRCSDSSASSIFCKNISDTSQGQTTPQNSFSATVFMSTYSTLEELFASTSTARYYDTDQSPSTNDTQRKSSASDELTLKISLPVIIVFILLLCAMAVVFFSRRNKMTRNKMTRKDRTTKPEVESGPKKNIVSDDSQYISKEKDLLHESPYNNSEEGVYDHLRDKKSRKPEVEDTYQHASAGVSRDMSEYDTMVNTVNKKQEEDASYDYSHQKTNGNYVCDFRAKNHLTDDPYDVAV